MKPVHRNRRSKFQKRNIETVAMTPMIDVVFQMLIYFVLTFEVPDHLSQMQVWRPTGPGPGGILPPQIGIQAGYYTWDSQRVSLKQMEQVLNRLADLNPDQSLIVCPSVDSVHRDLVTLLDLMNKSGLENISLISTE